MTDLSPDVLANTRTAMARGLLATIIHVAEGDRIAAVAACDGALDVLAAKAPDAAPAFGGAREEASWWVEFTSDTMRVAMLEAILKHMTQQQVNSFGARKRALVSIWNTLSDDERTAFLRHVGAKE